MFALINFSLMRKWKIYRTRWYGGATLAPIILTAAFSFFFWKNSVCSRPRDRYRERENGRSSNEGSARTNAGSLQPDTATSSSMATPAIVLSGSRPFSGQPPTILQSRDRQDDCGSSYEENFEGSKDSGDTGSVGDPDSITAFDGQSVGFGSAQRHGSRGSKSRQVMERREGRERDGRREGKWERKHSWLVTCWVRCRFRISQCIYIEGFHLPLQIDTASDPPWEKWMNHVMYLLKRKFTDGIITNSCSSYFSDLNE